MFFLVLFCVQKYFFFFFFWFLVFNIYYFLFFLPPADLTVLNAGMTRMIVSAIGKPPSQVTKENDVFFRFPFFFPIVTFFFFIFLKNFHNLRHSLIFSTISNQLFLLFLFLKKSNILLPEVTAFGKF